MRFSSLKNTLYDCSGQRDRVGSLLNSCFLRYTSERSTGLALSNRATGLIMNENRHHGNMKEQMRKKEWKRVRKARSQIFNIH